MTLNQPTIKEDIADFQVWIRWYIKTRSYNIFSKFEFVKDIVVDLLYKRRGKYARPILHTLTVVLLFFGITLGPLIVKNNALAENSDATPSSVLMNSSGQDIEASGINTIQGEDVLRYRGGEIYQHTVQQGETLKSIAEKYNLKEVNTLAWLNGISPKSPIKPGQVLKILPVDGVLHKVKKGDTLCSISRVYGLINKDEDCNSGGAQPIVDYPFNTFTDDQFGLQVGQYLVIPDGVMPEPEQPQTAIARKLTPNAGAVSATGKFSWPTQGVITQKFSWYHKGIDIANHVGTPILAADSGRVIVAGWKDNTGYGNRVMIDHGNGYITLYAHMSVIAVQEGQTVRRGDVLGQMGSTGRSTGPHCHFEIRHGGVNEDPFSYLK
jgi:murein DD-endopeptidase MepM/ murein hydrolase activator NlpD